MGTTWPCFNSQAEYSWKKMLYIWWDQFGVVYYELLKPNETITGAFYRTQLMRLSRALKEKRAHYYFRHDKILLHNNARPHVAVQVKTYLETLKWEVLSHCILQTLLLPTTTYSDRWRMADLSSTSHHMKIPKIVSLIDSVLPTRYPHDTRKMEK